MNAVQEISDSRNSSSTRGRRRLTDAEKRSNKKTTNFSDSELSVVEQLAAQAELTVSDYLRTAALCGDVRGAEKALERDVVKALGQASSAVNELSAKAHGRGGAIGKAECAELVDALLELSQQMSEIRSALYKH